MGFIALNTDQMVGTVDWIRLNVSQLSRDLMANDREKIELAERRNKKNAREINWQPDL